MKEQLAFITLCSLLVLGCSCSGSYQNNAHPITFKFVDEKNQPIKGDFTLHQYKMGRFKKIWHRHHQLDEEGTITIQAFPPEFQFGGTSEDEFYHYWLKDTDIDFSKSNFLYRCSPSGAMKFEIVAFPQKYYKSLVAEYHKKDASGIYTKVKGIGIVPDDNEHVIGGLEPGEYFIAIKFKYADSKPIYLSNIFRVETKKYATLPKITISEADIERSKP